MLVKLSSWKEILVVNANIKENNLPRPKIKKII